MDLLLQLDGFYNVIVTETVWFCPVLIRSGFWFRNTFLFLNSETGKSSNWNEEIDRIFKILSKLPVENVFTLILTTAFLEVFLSYLWLPAGRN